MKEGWEYKKLSDLYDVRDGTHDSPKYHETGYPLVTSKNLRGGILDMSNVSFISGEDYKAINNRSKVDIGDVLFAMIGTIGNPVYVQETPNYAIKNMALFKVPSNQSGEFLRYYLLNDNVLLKMQNESKGTTQKFVSLGYLRNFIIKIPSLSEQQSIVEYLDSAFAKIDAMKANAEKALNEAKALFQASLKEMLEPKEGWEEKTIGEVSLLKSGNSDANKSKPGSLPYVKVGDMNLKGNETYITVSSTYVDRQDNIKNIFPIGTLIFPKRGGAIFTNKKRLTEIEICCDLNVMGVIPNKNSVLPLFLYYFFNTIDFNIFKDEGASIPQINNKNIAPIMICLPSLSEQQSIVVTLDSLKSKVDRLQSNFEKISQECDALKQALLREVFEG